MKKVANIVINNKKDAKKVVSPEIDVEKDEKKKEICPECEYFVDTFDDGGICCDGCNYWIHFKCARILAPPETTHWYCVNCIEKFNSRETILALEKEVKVWKTKDNRNKKIIEILRKENDRLMALSTPLPPSKNDKQNKTLVEDSDTQAMNLKKAEKPLGKTYIVSDSHGRGLLENLGNLAAIKVADVVLPGAPVSRVGDRLIKSNLTRQADNVILIAGANDYNENIEHFVQDLKSLGRKMALSLKKNC